MKVFNEGIASDSKGLSTSPDRTSIVHTTRMLIVLVGLLRLSTCHRQRNSEATSSKEAMLKSRHDGFGLEVCRNDHGVETEPHPRHSCSFLLKHANLTWCCLDSPSSVVQNATTDAQIRGACSITRHCSWATPLTSPPLLYRPFGDPFQVPVALSHVWLLC